MYTLYHLLISIRYARHAVVAINVFTATFLFPLCLMMNSRNFDFNLLSIDSTCAFRVQLLRSINWLIFKTGTAKRDHT